MGRYAYFSTGIEYKFAFAIQESDDILEFGGYQSIRDPEKIVWIAETDKGLVEECIRDFGVPMLDMSAYEKTLDGYLEYMQDVNRKLSEAMKIPERIDLSEEEQEYLTPFYFLKLGHSIYFQLHMTPVLQAEYER